MHNNINFRVYVRNKNRYNPETKERGFLFVDVHDFAGTTIGQIKDDVRRQSKGTIRIDELFLNNLSLADDRSVAHYNLDNGCILETSSNPFWVSCLYIKASEIKQTQEGNPTDEKIQKWTQKSLPKKYTLIGLLLNAKNEYGKQPPHFTNLDEFAAYLETLKKKGATMHPEYTQKDLRAFEREYKQEFVGRYDDPLAAFIDHHAVRLGHVLPDEIEHAPGSVAHFAPRIAAERQKRATNKTNARKNQRYCEDCEEAVAVVYCGECQGGLAMCRRCSDLLHAGASRRRHNLQDMDQAPKQTSKPYIPRAFQAPFAIILAMYSALNERQVLSLTEDEIKKQAQLLTDTDLQDKQAGKYVGGFDCMENNLMNKGLVKKEAARVPTYALSASGQDLGERLYVFYKQYYRFMESCRLPKIQNQLRNGSVNKHKLCLIIDDNERDKERLLRYAREKNIDAEVRLLPAGDYIWILTSPLCYQPAQITGKNSDNEMVLPFVVERKSWEDFENSTNSARFQRQINNMLGCGLAHCFYLMEGSMAGLRNNTHHQQHYLKQQLEKLLAENGFYVNYTSSWMKSAQWLLWFTGCILDGLSSGMFLDQCIPYRELLGKEEILSAILHLGMFQDIHIHGGLSCLLTTSSDSEKEQDMMTTVHDMGVVVSDRYNKHLLVIQDLEQYNKKRQSSLRKCCEAVYANPGGARDIVEDKLGPVIHNLMHYDIACYWQLYIQIMTGVYVVRTETDPDTDRIQRLFNSTIPAQIPQNIGNSVTAGLRGKNNVRSRNAGSKKKTATATYETVQPDRPRYTPACSTHTDANFNQQSRKLHISGSAVNSASKTDHNLNLWEDHSVVDEDIETNRGEHIRTIFTVDNSSPALQHVSDDKDGGHSNVTDNHGVPGCVIKRGRNSSANQVQKKLLSIKQCDVQPFSGQGYCLSAVYNDENIRDNASSSKVNMTDESDELVRNTHIHTGLVGGTNDFIKSSTNKTIEEGGIRDEALNKSVIDAADFTNSQNEEDIMLKVLAESAAETKSNSNEDEMLKLAVEMSVHSAANSEHKDTTSELTEEEQIQLAIEMSKSSDCTRNCERFNRAEKAFYVNRSNIHKNDTPVSHLFEEKDIHGLARIKNKTSVIDSATMSYERSGVSYSLSNPCENFNKNVMVNNDEEMFNAAVEMSLKELKSTDIQNKYGVDDNDDVIVILDDEDDSQNVASKKIHSSNFGDYINHLGDEYTDNDNRNRKCNKRKLNDNLRKRADKLNEEYAAGLLSEEEHVNKAVEMSLAWNSSLPGDRINTDSGDVRNSCQLLSDRADAWVSPCKKMKPTSEGFRDFDSKTKIISLDNSNEDHVLQMVVERSKIEHSPFKKVRLGNKYVDEEEMVNIVLERSKKETCSQLGVKYGGEVKNHQNAGISELIEIDSQSSQEELEIIDTNSDCVVNSCEVEQTVLEDTGYSISKLAEQEGIADNIRGTVDDKSSNTDLTNSFILGTDDVYTETSDHNIDKKDVSVLHGNDFANDEVNETGDCNISLHGDQDNDNVLDCENDCMRNEPHDSDNDYIPPSPTAACTPEGVSFKQIYFSQTPNSVLNKSFSPYFIQDKSSDKGKKFDFVSSLMYDSEESNSDDDDDNDDESDDDDEMDHDCDKIDSEKNEGQHETNASSHFTNKSCEIQSKQVHESCLNEESSEKSEIIQAIVENNANCIFDTVKSNDITKCYENVCDTDTDDFDEETDIDYQPDSQYIAELEAQSVQTEDDVNIDLEEKALENSDPELLPVIRRPRGFKYRELQEASKRLLEQKKQEMFLNNTNHCVKIKTEFYDDTEDESVAIDEMVARQLQNEFDNDASTQSGSHIDDEYIARQMQEMFDKEKSRNSNDSVVPPGNKDKQIEGNLNTTPNTELNKTADESSDNIVRELQRREFEKIERWRQLLLEDERLAKRMQEMHDTEMPENKETNTPLKKDANSQEVTPCFKQIVARHKVSREKALTQLQEYRRLQMERFQGFKSQSSHITHIPDTNRYITNTQQQQNDVMIVDEPLDVYASQRHKAHSNHKLTTPHHAADIHPSTQSTSTSAGTQPSTHGTSTSIGTGPFSHCTSTLTGNSNTQTSLVGTSMQAITDEDKETFSNQNNQDGGMKTSNITCGNCGEKGHNRTFIKCPRYHTAEESARREAKFAKQRQQKEEKKRQEVETIDLLTEHRRVLEDMTSQIQRDMNTIQHRMQQRASELETEVNVRVKKIENAKKKKK